jgi:hypothetical protein
VNGKAESAKVVAVWTEPDRGAPQEVQRPQGEARPHILVGRLAGLQAERAKPGIRLKLKLPARWVLLPGGEFIWPERPFSKHKPVSQDDPPRRIQAKTRLGAESRRTGIGANTASAGKRRPRPVRAIASRLAATSGQWPETEEPSPPAWPAPEPPTEPPRATTGLGGQFPSHVSTGIGSVGDAAYLVTKSICYGRARPRSVTKSRTHPMPAQKQRTPV